MNVLFLDFDGVLLNQATRFRTMDPACVAYLDALCRAADDLPVVISSTWRHIGLGRCRAMLREAGFTGRVIGATPVLWGCSRGEEIDRWLDAHPEYTRPVILDDDADMGGLTPALVRTETLIGLTEREARRVLDLLAQTTMPAATGVGEGA